MKKILIRSFTPQQFAKVDSEMPGLTHRRILAIGLSDTSIDVAYEEIERKASDKADYGSIELPGERVQYVARVDGITVGDGNPNLVKKATFNAFVTGVAAILAQSGPDAHDIICAPIDGRVEVFCQKADGEQVNLAATGWKQVTWNKNLQGLLGVKNGDQHLYFLPASEMKLGNFGLGDWTQSTRSLSTGNPTRLPYRITTKNLRQVFVTTAGGMETVDLSAINNKGALQLGHKSQGQQAFQVIGETDTGGVFVQNSATKATAIVPNAQSYQAALEQIKAASQASA